MMIVMVIMMMTLIIKMMMMMIMMILMMMMVLRMTQDEPDGDIIDAVDVARHGPVPPATSTGMGLEYQSNYSLHTLTLIDGSLFYVHTELAQVIEPVTLAIGQYRQYGTFSIT